MRAAALREPRLLPVTDLLGPEVVIAILVGIFIDWIFSDDGWDPPFRKESHETRPPVR